MERKTMIIVGIVTAVVVAGGITLYVVINKKKKEEGGKGGNSNKGGGDTGEQVTEGGEGTIGSNEKLPSSNFPLKLGSRGRKVLMVQQALKLAGENITVDGRFGDETARKQYAWCLKPSLQGDTDACQVSQTEFNTMMTKAGGQQAVLNAIMNNSVTKNIYNQYL